MMVADIADDGSGTVRTTIRVVATTAAQDIHD
jgi:hypothetical protein